VSERPLNFLGVDMAGGQRGGEVVPQRVEAALLWIIGLAVLTTDVGDGEILKR